MKYTKFTIENFKGIQKVEFDIDQKNPKSKIFTLVGLNESGKTTILEALSFFYDNIKDTDELSITKAIVDDVHDLIPKSKKDLFSDHILIRATLVCDENDIKLFKQELKKHNCIYVSHLNEFTITVRLNFKDSTFVNKTTSWAKDIVTVKGKGQIKGRDLYTFNREAWNRFTTYISSNLAPAIIYYPNFLFNFPEQITLESTPEESKDLIFYRNVLQDILTSINPELLLKEHVLDRYKADTTKDKDAADAVINKMSGQVTRFLTKSKMSAFNKLLEKKEILIKYPKKNNEGQFFIEIKLKSGDEEYYIKERSLGFRWFFTYLLFTQFRTFRKGTKNLCFLFDEPASNLHQTGQHRLLDAFDELITDSNNIIIYSTHSHHLINPRWLESTYIVRNNALNYEDEGNFNSNMTDISVLRYRTFVGRYPKLLNYFQPILDILEYRPSNLENIPDVVMIEGKNDFFTLEYFNKVLGFGKKINLLPGTGSGTLDNIIQLYYSWGRRFVVMVDGDKSGEKQVVRYKEKFGSIVDERIFCFTDVDEIFKNNALEKLISNQDLLKIQTTIFSSDTQYDKYRFNLAIQELLGSNVKIEISKDTQINIEKVLKFVSEKLKPKK